ncbi:MAG: NINE protein [Asgard group archaeon]|nr:NINE protein [Asgard group archaeon]
MKIKENKIALLLIVVFIGEFGIHRFIKGHIITGIIWLLTGGLFLVGWILDIIYIATDREPLILPK